MTPSGLRTGLVITVAALTGSAGVSTYLCPYLCIPTSCTLPDYQRTNGYHRNEVHSLRLRGHFLSRNSMGFIVTSSSARWRIMSVRHQRAMYIMCTTHVQRVHVCFGAPTLVQSER